MIPYYGMPKTPETRYKHLKDTKVGVYSRDQDPATKKDLPHNGSSSFTIVERIVHEEH